MNIAIVDYGAGNVRSVQFAVERLGYRSALVDAPDGLQAADRIIFPGVGAAGAARQALMTSGLWEVIPTLQQPLLAICLGMQLLAEASAENNTPGLGIVPGRVAGFQAPLRVPHMGWNRLVCQNDPLLEGLPSESYAYFVHSYFLPPVPQTIASTKYGTAFTAALRKNNFWACQFHPEKSGAVGAQILKNFLERCE
ncbi:MAG: imidazole glycerol phosphate synthase subunit HisH [Salibacteraceae bacterium]